MGWADRLEPQDVDTVKKFAVFCEQETGIPYPTGKQFAMLNGSVKEFFEKYPHANFYSLCRMVDWAKAKRKRYATPGGLVKGGMRFAWADGFLPECDKGYVPDDPQLEAKIAAAIALETYDNRAESSDGWLRRLMVSEGHTARQEVYDAWTNERGSIYGIDRVSVL